MNMTFKEFSRLNRLRCESEEGFNHQLNAWSASDWMTALVGEIGEAANIIKKLNRMRDGVRGNTETFEQLHTRLRQELGDAQIYLDLLAQSQGFNIGDAAIEVFNAKSVELHCSIIIPQCSCPTYTEPNCKIHGTKGVIPL